MAIFIYFISRQTAIIIVNKEGNLDNKMKKWKKVQKRAVNKNGNNNRKRNISSKPEAEIDLWAEIWTNS